MQKPELDQERTEYAEDRTVLANERTYSAWVRTGFAAMASGLAAVKLLGDVLPRWSLLIISTVFILYGAFAFVAAAWRYRCSLRAYRGSDAPQLSFPVIVIANGLLLVTAAVALLGLWMFP